MNSLHKKLNYNPLEKMNKMIPGPGNYELTFVNKRSSPKFSSGTEKRDFNLKFSNIPAPNCYSPNFMATV
jgi:hypothetical protein